MIVMLEVFEVSKTFVCLKEITAHQGKNGHINMNFNHFDGIIASKDSGVLNHGHSILGGSSQ